jgi:hypothetical protein
MNGAPHCRLDDNKRGGLPVMMVEVMKVAQQPAVAYDKVRLSTGVILGKSGLLLKFLYVSRCAVVVGTVAALISSDLSPIQRKGP